MRVDGDRRLENEEKLREIPVNAANRRFGANGRPPRWCNITDVL
jgi:hypothetical protein